MSYAAAALILVLAGVGVFRVAWWIKTLVQVAFWSIVMVVRPLKMIQHLDNEIAEVQKQAREDAMAYEKAIGFVARKRAAIIEWMKGRK